MKIPLVAIGKGSTPSLKTFNMRPTAPGLEVPGLTEAKANLKQTTGIEYLGPKLVIVMVGLPARGKATSLRSWLDISTGSNMRR